MPRITALLMLRSTISTASAPAISPFRGSITPPTQSLCTLRGRRHRRLTQHSLPGGLLGLTWAGLAPADRASFAWRLQKCGLAPRVGICLLPQREADRRAGQIERLAQPVDEIAAIGVRERVGAGAEQYE